MRLRNKYKNDMKVVAFLDKEIEKGKTPYDAKREAMKKFRILSEKTIYNIKVRVAKLQSQTA